MNPIEQAKKVLSALAGAFVVAFMQSLGDVRKHLKPEDMSAIAKAVFRIFVFTYHAVLRPARRKAMMEDIRVALAVVNGRLYLPVLRAAKENAHKRLNLGILNVAGFAINEAGELVETQLGPDEEEIRAALPEVDTGALDSLFEGEEG